MVIIIIEKKNCIICMLLIHSGRLQKMLTALFILFNLEYSENYVDNYQGKMFLNIENVWCLNALTYCFLLTYNLRNVSKQNWH